MRSKVKHVLLINKEASTIKNLMTVSSHEMFSEVSSVNNTNDGLSYLADAKNGKFKTPNLIFLDSNLPGIKEGDFLKEYKKLGSEITSKIKVVLLSTLEESKELKNKLTKFNIEDVVDSPLSLNMLSDIYKKHFTKK